MYTTRKCFISLSNGSAVPRRRPIGLEMNILVDVKVVMDSLDQKILYRRVGSESSVAIIDRCEEQNSGIDSAQ